VPVDPLLLGQIEQVALTVTSPSAFSPGVESFVTTRIRPSADRTAGPCCFPG
jgi:hypothetical protein